MLFKLCAALSHLVYSKSDKLLFTTIGNATYIAFKGTEHWYDMLNCNVYSMYESESFTFLHMTINSACKTYLFQLFNDHSDTIAKIVAESKKVVFTGHSLGGFVAHVCAEIYGTTAISFGAPRFFKQIDKVNGKHYRVCHQHDKIPHLPDYKTWKHVESTKIVVGKDEEQVDNKYENQYTFLVTHLLNLNYQYHSIDTYVDTIKKTTPNQHT